MKSNIFLFVCLCLTMPLLSQDSIEFFKFKSFTELNNLIRNSQEKTQKETYIQFYLDRAKKENDTIKIAEAYEFKSSLFYPDSLSLKFADSIIQLTKNIKHKKFPAAGYNLKGAVFYELGDYTRALDFYLIASKTAKKNDNQFQYITSKFNIGLLKNILGERKEALTIFKDYLTYIEKYKENNQENYIRGLFAISDSYVYSREIDAAEVYIQKGINNSLNHKNKYHYEYFVFISGINSFFKSDYLKAIDSLKKAKKAFYTNGSENTRLAMCNYYIGRSFYELKMPKKGVGYFKSVDSILEISDDVNTELIDSYNYLIEDAKNNKELNFQIKYINSLTKYDSVIDENFKYIKSNIVKKYEIPQLLAEKELVIEKLNKNTNNITLFASLIILLLLLFLFFVFRKNLVYKKRFDGIINKDKISDKKTNYSLSSKELPEELINEILKSLNQFEKSQKFIKRKYTLNSLSKELKTNSSYLSKVINLTKGVNFSNYLNNLKVDYAIDRLKKDKKFRSYTIKAIALESGFSNSQTFSVAFRNKTGLYPSYFTKKLNQFN